MSASSEPTSMPAKTENQLNTMISVEEFAEMMKAQLAPLEEHMNTVQIQMENLSKPSKEDYSKIFAVADDTTKRASVTDDDKRSLWEIPYDEEYYLNRNEVVKLMDNLHRASKNTIKMFPREYRQTAATALTHTLGAVKDLVVQYARIFAVAASGFSHKLVELLHLFSVKVRQCFQLVTSTGVPSSLGKVVKAKKSISMIQAAKD